MEALKLRFAARADRQLEEILTYIAFDNPEAAQHIVEHIESLMEKVLAHPEIGRKIFENLPHREVVAYPCRLIYRRKERSLEIVAVLRVEQLLRRSLLDT
jgi:toxin ParE1/3/4